MQDRRTFLGQSLAFAAVLPGILSGPASSDTGLPGLTAGQDGAGPAALPGTAALDVRPLGGGMFLVSGWVLTAADLDAAGITHSAGTANRAA